MRGALGRSPLLGYVKVFNRCQRIDAPKSERSKIVSQRSCHSQPLSFPAKMKELMRLNGSIGIFGDEERSIDCRMAMKMEDGVSRKTP